jgi:hypothetical protein
MSRANRLSIGVAANYSAVEALRDGRRVENRAFKPSDRTDLESALACTSSQSHYRRFFTVKRSFSEREQEFFLNVDFVDTDRALANKRSARSVGKAERRSCRTGPTSPWSRSLPRGLGRLSHRRFHFEWAEGPGTATAGDCHRKGPAPASRPF